MQHELLKAGTSALAEGTSVLNRLQQDTAIKDGSAWLKELQPHMGRMKQNYQLRVQCNSASIRAEIEAKKLPLTERLLQPYWDCGCEDVFIIFFPPWRSSMATGRTHCDSLLEEISLEVVRQAIASRTRHSTSTATGGLILPTHAWC